MVDLKILKEKIHTLNSLVKLTKTLAGIIFLLNIGGFIYNKTEFSIILSLIFLIFLWLWALDAQVGKIEEHLNLKKHLKEKKGTTMNKKAMTESGRIIFFTIIILLIIYIGIQIKKWL